MSEKKGLFAVDVAGRCIDRNSEEGKLMEECQRVADSKAGTKMGDFMNQILAYTDVTAFVDATMDGRQAGETIGKLRTKMKRDNNIA